ncbi:mitochondrial ATP synthase epsilon chain-domain-containing protein, partial [Endogone sp. FLAS-F59071]
LKLTSDWPPESKHLVAVCPSLVDHTQPTHPNSFQQMAFAWKSAGITYLKFSEACARAVRNSLKEDLRVVAQRREQNLLKFAKWESGKQGELKYVIKVDQ